MGFQLIHVFPDARRKAGQIRRAERGCFSNVGPPDRNAEQVGLHLHQNKTAGSTGVLRRTGFGAQLSEKRGLLVAGNAGGMGVPKRSGSVSQKKPLDGVPSASRARELLVSWSSASRCALCGASVDPGSD